MARYRPVFAMATSVKNNPNRTLKKPAAKVIGSPIMGSQLNKRLHTPNR